MHFVPSVVSDSVMCVHVVPSVVSDSVMCVHFVQCGVCMCDVCAFCAVWCVHV